MPVVEHEIRRQCPLTPEIKKQLCRLYTTPERIEYILFCGSKRAILNDKPKVEFKKIIYSKPFLLYSDFAESLELCYESEETLLPHFVTNNMIKHGILAKKTFYFTLDTLVIYTLESLEVSLESLQLSNKLVMELEAPEAASDKCLRLYMKTAFEFGLLPDPKQIKQSVEQVIHNSILVFNSSTKYPKVDGERGIFNVFLEARSNTYYETYTSNTTSFITRFSESWGKELSFFLLNVPIVAERVEDRIVFIDLALSSYLNAEERLGFIYRLGKRVREVLKISENVGVLFQSYDVEYIKENCATDGSIIIYKGELHKDKHELTVDLRYSSNLKAMLDNDGIIYKIDIELEDDEIYECILDECYNVSKVLRVRNDKFFPNSRNTVMSVIGLRDLGGD